MASNVVVLSSSARQAIIKTTPNKFLSDILQEACTKLGVDSAHHGLRHNKRNLDLSNTFKISGLPSGARLELVFISRSPSVIAVALQLPDPESRAVPGNRLIERFPSSTTLWHILRRFESGPPGPPRNFTARGVPKIGSEDREVGRLYHQNPVIEVMGRELSSFTDLQKTLSQLGFNTGSVALRLKFHISDTPLEQALEQIDEYFKSIELESERHQRDALETSEIVQPNSNSSPSSQAEPISPPSGTELLSSLDNERSSAEGPNPSELPVKEDVPSVHHDQRLVSVIAPPKSSTPYAALQEWNEKDYIPSAEDALRHQARLSKSGRNQRLKSDSEILAEKKERQEKAASVKEVEIKIRFPDQYCVVYKFSDSDTTTTLYDFVKNLLENENEPFLLNFISATGPKTVPKEDIKLIGPNGLDMKGRLLVNVIWAPGASRHAREGKFLKADIRAQAKEIEIPKPENKEPKEEQKQDTALGQAQSGNGKGKGKGLPKWLKGLPGKK